MSNAPVVAAVDGSDHSLQALEWARTAALRHRTGLVVAHVLPDTSQLYAARRSSLADPSQPEEFADPVGERVRGILAEAPELPEEVRYDALEGSVPEALRVTGDGALMLVMGSRGRGGFAALLLGSNSRALASTAACPVVVIAHAARRAPAAEPSDGAAGSAASAGAAGAAASAGAAGSAGSAGRVVLGLHAAETADDVLAFAFAEAAARGTTVQVVSAYAIPPAPTLVMDSPFQVIPPEGLADDGDAVPAEREMLRSQTERLAPFRARWPQVRVEQAAVPGDPAERLVTASRSAALVVVGRHHPRRSVGPVMIGSVAHAVLHHAHGPVAVVPTLSDDS
ncbi:universal stress protein [Streptomyces sp. KS 21]|uniref:universal stress protein n=1 Tax=Streptomyces sp. KS 21 TaxID=2485150 RepID=UPI0010646161|nr:universal stress protein [Streptomyces sp. KS 21]TDU77306.1 nucleotide-binding universal stress UspA family protein [Streptomyces sp. KS 21]